MSLRGLIWSRWAAQQTWDINEFYKAKNITEKRFNRWGNPHPCRLQKDQEPEEKWANNNQIKYKKKILVFIFFVSVFPFNSYIPSSAIFSSLLTFLENRNQHSLVSVTAVSCSIFEQRFSKVHRKDGHQSLTTNAPTQHKSFNAFTLEET